MADYKETLNMPSKKIDETFPMRAGLPVREPVMLASWQEKDIYGALMKENEGKPLFVLHDGPPFSNGNIHMGTAMNKVLKDFILRYKNMAGFKAPYTPGWDNHGMPIESAIIKKNKLNRKEMTIPEFRKACHAFAEDFVNIQMSQFKRLGVLGDWDNPYLTMNPSFEAIEVKVFGEMFKKGYIYKGLKPVYWCTHDETALAEAEIEYADDKCTSIYVKFQVKNDNGKLASVVDLNKTYFIIWTTTTWTLPGNVAIALNPYESYVVLQADNGENYIVAEALADKTMKAGNVASYKVLANFTGKDFEFMTAQHPFLERESMLVTADYVTMDSGTGCVHTAPGFGADDYQTCRRYNIDLIVPVDDKGYQTADAGKFAGMYYADSNKAILEDMTQSGALFASEEIVHQYPHCWRCKQPIIFRATPQWFCSVDAFKEEAVKACADVQWIPEWGGERISQMVRERADWCISRQRHWGLPIPVLYCDTCKKPVCTEETVESISKLFGEFGSNIWFEREADELVPKGFKCPHCGGTHFYKETDTLDGWFDSGSSHFNVCNEGYGLQWPADLYLEGADQYRGWFQSSLLTSVGVKGTAPYKAVLTHGWVVDGEGKAMHKSLGNSIAPEEIIAKYGADVLRVWVASSDYHADVRVSDEIFKQLSQAYLKIRNTARYILGNLEDFNPKTDMVALDKLEELDAWALGRLSDVIEKCTKGYDSYEFYNVFHAVHNFCVVDLSNFYLDILKDRLYCDGKTSATRRSAQTAMYLILDALTRLIAPILAYTSEEIWAAMPHADESRVSVLLAGMPKISVNVRKVDSEKWNLILNVRDDVKKALELARNEKLIGKPLEADVELHCTGELYKQLKAMENELAEIFITSCTDVINDENGAVKGENASGLSVTVKHAENKQCERCWKFDSTVDESGLCHRCASVVKAL